MANGLEYDPQRESFPINTENEFAVTSGQNLANHTSSLQGRGRYIQFSSPIRPMRTKQAVYRVCAWLLTLAPSLPDEEGEHSFEEIQEAIENS